MLFLSLDLLYTSKNKCTNKPSREYYCKIFGFETISLFVRSIAMRGKRCCSKYFALTLDDKQKKMFFLYKSTFSRKFNNFHHISFAWSSQAILNLNSIVLTCNRFDISLKCSKVLYKINSSSFYIAYFKSV